MAYHLGIDVGTTLPAGTTAGSGVDLGAIDLGGLGGGTAGADLPVPDPLPGDDWNDAARTLFVQDCSTGIATQMASVGGDPVARCGCVYDDVSTSSEFDDFDDQWASPDFDPSSPVGQDLTGVLFACAGVASGG